MAKQLTDLPEHTRFGFPIREPFPVTLGFCPCGCNEALQSGYEALEWNDMVFYDEFHLVKYLEKTDGLRRVS
jgi:hypothetical protein